MSTINNSREERRRRILERGSDRLALITGRVQNLPSSPLSPIDHHDLFSPVQHRVPETLFSRQFNARAGVVGDAFIPTSVRIEAGSEASRANTSDIGSQVELKLQNIKTGKERKTEVQTLHVASTIQKASNNPETHQTTLGHQPRLFSSRRLNYCILASEGIRSFSALMMALFVVLSYIDHPMFGIDILRWESVAASRPLYMLLLTDITIVFSRMYLERQRDAEEDEEVAPQNDGHNWAEAVRLMERGLVAYQIIRAIFIDCSIYSAVVVCGLSLV